jgi:ferric-dicitrate binding protein FerR (iron transport regulator)
MNPMQRHIEAIAAHFVIELDDPECTAEMRDECEAWLASAEEHRRVFNALQRAWRESVTLARLLYMRRQEH